MIEIISVIIYMLAFIGMLGLIAKVIIELLIDFWRLLNE